MFPGGQMHSRIKNGVKLCVIHLLVFSDNGVFTSTRNVTMERLAVA